MDQLTEVLLSLSEAEVLALKQLAKIETRTIQEQAVHLICLALIERGFIKDTAQMNESQNKRFIQFDE